MSGATIKHLRELVANLESQKKEAHLRRVEHEKDKQLELAYAAREWGLSSAIVAANDMIAKLAQDDAKFAEAQANIQGYW